ncbi:MAG: type II secretion system F family protein [Acidobacteriota bacterium]
MSESRSLGRAILPVEAMHALADLVAAGYSLSAALEALPRRSLSRRLRAALDLETARLQAGGSLAEALDRLGLESTALSVTRAQASGALVEERVRADARARAEEQSLWLKTRIRLTLFGLALGTLASAVVYVSYFYVPRVIETLDAHKPPGFELPPTLAGFEAFRDFWLALGSLVVLGLVGLFVLYWALASRRSGVEILQDLRLRLPFFRQHAIHSSSARLLEALANDQELGVGAGASVRRLASREPVPRLRESLNLIAARLDAGDPWQVCPRGSLLETPVLADLAGLADRGAKPSRGWRWGAQRHRDQASRGLRRGVIAGAVLVVVPSVLYTLILLQAASVTATVAQVESARQQIELMSREVERIIDGEE